MAEAVYRTWRISKICRNGDVAMYPAANKSAGWSRFNVEKTMSSTLFVSLIEIEAGLGATILDEFHA